MRGKKTKKKRWWKLKSLHLLNIIFNLLQTELNFGLLIFFVLFIFLITLTSPLIRYLINSLNFENVTM